MKIEKTKSQQAWEGFKVDRWTEKVDVANFIRRNYVPYEGDESFLAGSTEATKKLWAEVAKGIEVENKTKAPLDFDCDIPSTITSHKAGYIEKELEKIVGLQTDAPLKRAIMPNGGIRMVETSCEIYGKKLNPLVKEIFTKYRKTHNDMAFAGYTDSIRKCRKSGILTGLPDAYGRGRIIGDYRRIALYGIDALISDKKRELLELDDEHSTEDVIKLRIDLTEQMRALSDMKVMASSYGYDISHPAMNAREAVQWTYFGYLAAIKSQNGAAMSVGRISTFLDVYIERDINKGILTETEAQELVDHLVMKFRMVRFLRTPEYDELFSGDPIWATESVGGMGLDGRTLVSKTSFRFLNTLYTMGPSPEPNITILWSESLPEGFKRYTAKVSIETSSIQYENDDLMRPTLSSDDYGIACCVSPMIIGKQMQFFGARANLAKTLLYAINGGVDEISKEQISTKLPPVSGDVLEYDDVMARLDKTMDWLAFNYVNALNVIHYSHDRFSYESALMALHDRDVYRMLACGIAGLSITADSLSAIKYAKVEPVRDEGGLCVDFKISGEYPTFGNNDDRVDSIAVDLVERFMNKIKSHKVYRNAVPTQSVLTITSNVVYGKKTGNTPDGRRSGEPFAPGANPMHGRDVCGAVASLNSVAKLPFTCARDGISYTFSIVPSTLGKSIDEQKKNLVFLMDGYFANSKEREGGQHLNVNVLDRNTLLDAMENPEKYPHLTIRVSGYAVRFNSLTKEQQKDVVSRTFTQSI